MDTKVRSGGRVLLASTFVSAQQYGPAVRRGSALPRVKLCTFQFLVDLVTPIVFKINI